jgi:hypothetical protein
VKAAGPVSDIWECWVCGNNWRVSSSRDWRLLIFLAGYCFSSLGVRIPNLGWLRIHAHGVVVLGRGGFDVFSDWGAVDIVAVRAVSESINTCVDLADEVIEYIFQVASRDIGRVFAGD